MRRRSFVLLGLVLTLLGSIPVAAAARQDVRLSLIGYAVPREAFAKIIPAFQKTPAGNDVSFSQSYGASGDQARAVAAGLKADVVQLSTGLDVEVLVKAGLVDKNWDRQSYRGIVTNSLVVFAVRDGNPKKIKGWNDLIKPGVQIVTPNPFTSGAAKWNILAAYGAQRRLGKTDRQGREFVEKLFRNVVSQDKSGRDATNTFLSGRGDVFITYENEALLARKNGQDIQYVIPRQTILIEAPVAVLRTSENIEQARAFTRYLRTVEAQRIFAENGFRPVNKAVAREFKNKYPSRPGVFTIEAKFINGWLAADKKWFDSRNGIMVGIQRKIGGPTG